LPGFPKFMNPYIYRFQLDSLSPAIDTAAALGVKLDLAGRVRDDKPDIGAYEWLPAD